MKTQCSFKMSYICNLNCTTLHHIPDKHRFKEIIIFHAIFNFKHMNCSRIHILLISFLKKDPSQQFVNSLMPCAELLYCIVWYQNQCFSLIWFQINCVSPLAKLVNMYRHWVESSLNSGCSFHFHNKMLVTGYLETENLHWFFYTWFCCSGTHGM
jgi:hypothetical protein